VPPAAPDTARRDRVRSATPRWERPLPSRWLQFTDLAMTESFGDHAI
jgi:hypothetical protein